MYDAPLISALLVEAGFSSIRPCDFGDCADPMFRVVEDKNRFSGSLALEATRAC
jgi:hypothetical protein